MCHFERSVWVSYASADQSLVQALTNYVKEHYNRTALQSQREIVPFYLRTYKRNKQDSTPLKNEDGQTESASSKNLSFLNAGESIAELVQVIAINLRRLLVISPSYLQSEHCMWEFCSCLASHHNHRICFLMLGFEQDGDWQNERVFDFVEGEKKDKVLTLAQGLAYVCQKKQLDFPFKADVNLSSDQDAERFFADKLNHLSDQVYIKVSAKHDNIHEYDEGEIATLADEIKSYANSFNIEDEIKEFNEFIIKTFNVWAKEAHAKKYLDAFKSKEGSEFTQQDLIALNLDMIKKFVKFLIKNENFDDDEKKQAKQKITLRHFAGVLALLLLDKAWIGEMRRSSLRGMYIRVADQVFIDEQSSEDDLRQKKKAFRARIADCAIRQMEIKLLPPTDIGTPPEVDVGHQIVLPKGTVEDIDRNRSSKETMEEKAKPLLVETLCKMLDDNEENINKRMKDSAWPSWVRDNVYERIDKRTGLFLDACFFVERSRFQESMDAIERTIFYIIERINEHAPEDEKIKIGVSTISNRDEGNTIQLLGQANTHGGKYGKVYHEIVKLMEC